MADALLELDVRPAPAPLPVVLRHALVAMVDALSYRVDGVGGFHLHHGRINAPGFLADLKAALWSGDIAASRRVLRQFGVVANAPYANLQTVHALERALEAAFQVVELHANAAGSELPVESLLGAVAPGGSAP